MSLTIIALILGALFTVGVAGKAYFLGVDHEHVATLEAQAKVAAFESQLQKKADEQHQKDENYLIDTTAAWDAGHAKARVVYVKTETLGEQYAARPVFITAPCTMDADSLRLLRGARASLSAGDDTAEIERALSGGGVPDGRQVQSPVPAEPQGHTGTVEDVHRPPQGSSASPQTSSGGTGEVPASGRDRPKPKPVGQ